MVHFNVVTPVIPVPKTAIMASKRARLLAAEMRRILNRGRGTRKFDPLRFRPLQDRLETVDCTPACFVPEQLERVVACGFRSTLENEIQKLEATSWSESPTQVLHIRDAILLGGEVLTPSAHHFLSSMSPYRSLFRSLEFYDEISIPNSVQGLKYFGHWLRDDCAAFELATEMGGQVVSLLRPSWSDCAGYESRFDQTWEEKEAFYATHLCLFRDIGFNLDKRRRLQALRARVQGQEKNEGGVVYLRRGQGGKARSIIDEPSLIEGLSARGVRIAEPEQGAEAVFRTCMGADLIITVEGSQAAHALYLLKDGGSLLVLQPPDRFYNPHFEWTRMMGMRYGIVVGEADVGGMRLHLSEIMSMAERLMM